jgi:anti-anti-sigma factor
VSDGVQFSIEEEFHSGQPYVIRVAGELDGAVSDQLIESVGRAASDRPDSLLLDLEETTFLDSSGLRAILLGARSANGGRDAAFAVACGSQQVLKVFELTGVAKHLRIYPTREQALTALKSA